MGSLDLVVRTSQDATGALALMRNAVRTVNPNQTIGKFRTMDDLVARAVSPRRFLLWLLAAFAAIALFLAALGIYGVIAYGVAQRRQEIGIRMALGASAASVLRSVLGHSIGLTVLGWMLGGLGAFALSRLLSSLLYETQATDLRIFLLVGIVLLLVTSLASYGPARRAARIDPAITLRA
jgi:ABC-type antimicrobial peptide transport system permease subunit